MRLEKVIRTVVASIQMASHDGMGIPLLFIPYVVPSYIK